MPKIRKRMSTEYISKIAVLGGISSIFTLFHISVWFAPHFYKIDIADSVILIGGYALGSTAVLYMQIIKILLNLLMDSTTTFGIGEFANWLMGTVFVLPATLIYNKKKNFTYMIIGVIVGLIIVTFFSVIINLYITIPAYSIAFGLPIENIIELGKIANPNINNLTSLALYAIIPFNILKYTINSIIAISLYKKISIALKLNTID